MNSPRYILFPITYECNLSCKFCSVKNNREKVDIPKCIQFLETMRGKVPWVFVTGGEPFLVPNLQQICTKLKSMDFKVGVTTNGTFYQPDIANYIDRLGISLDGDEEYHDAYRGNGVFQKAVTLIKAAKGKCETVIMSTAFKGNEEALLKLKSVVEEINPTYWQIQRDVNDSSVVINPKLQEFNTDTQKDAEALSNVIRSLNK